VTGKRSALVPAPGRARAVAIRLLVFVACAAALTWTVHSLGPRHIFRLALDADPAWLLLSLGAVAARYLIWASKWRRMMRRTGPVGFGTTLGAILSGTLVNLVTPSAKLAGGVTRALLIRRRTGWRMALAYGWSLADQVTNVAGNLVLGGMLAGATAAMMPPSALRRALLGGGVAAVAIVALAVGLRGWAWNQVRRPAVARIAGRWTPARFRQNHPGSPAAAWLEPMLSPLLQLGSTWKGIGADVVLGAASWLSLCAANAMVFRALGVEASLFGIATALVLGVFAGTLTGTVGGIGATEIVLIGLYTRLGVPAEAAAAATLLHRGTYYGLSLLAGSLALLAGSRGPGVQLSKRDEDPPRAVVPTPP